MDYRLEDQLQSATFNSVAFGKRYKFSQPQFPYMQMKKDSTHSFELLLEELMCQCCKKTVKKQHLYATEKSYMSSIRQQAIIECIYKPVDK